MNMSTNPTVWSIDRVLEHVEHMRIHFPDRKSGAGTDLAAAKYVVERLAAHGLDAALQPFEALDSDIGSSYVALGGADGPVVASRPCLHVEPTAAGGLTAEVVDVGAGGLADYVGKDVAGKIVLAEVSYAPATPEKARIAAAHGAVAIVLMNWGLDDGHEIPWRALKSVWGNPTPETWGDMPRIAGVSISRADGIALRRRLEGAPVRLHLRLEANRVWRTLHQPVAWLRAPETAPERDRFVVVSGHLDSWNPGVTDNITGMSVMLEIARSLAARREELRRSIVFCFWNGHEVAEAAGSSHFVDAEWERLERHGVAYVNIDSVGMKGTSAFDVATSPELAGFATELARDVFADREPQRIVPLRRIGDQSFFGVGVSAATGRHGYSRDVITAQHGATLGWYNHTEFDTIDVMDGAVLAADLEWNARFVSALATMPVLPHRFAGRLAETRRRYGEAIEAGEDPAEFGRILLALDDLAPRVAAFDALLDRAGSDPDLAVRANGIALRLCRRLTFLVTTAVGRYGQDAYGVSTLAEPVPFLADLKRWRSLAPDALEARLLATSLIRRRHVVTDAIEAARCLLDDFAERVAPRDGVHVAAE